MNYRSFFKKSSGKILLPEGVDTEQLKMGIKAEKEHTKDVGIAAKIALDHLKEDPKYYTKLSQAGLEENDSEETLDTPAHKKTGWEADAEIGKMQDDPKHRPSPFNKNEHCGHCEDDIDDNDGLPKLGGALAIPHRGQPIHMSKIIQVGSLGQGGTGQSASGDLSGYTSVNKGVTKDSGGIAVQPDNEPITAGGKKVDSSIATKSVGGEVVPGEGQKQGGPNSQGTIANTVKMTEGKKRIRNMVKEVLKEITFNKKTGKWVRLTENTVNMKMGASYKVVPKTLAQTADQDWARATQYEPEITEMHDKEQTDKMEARMNELAVAQRSLSEAELTELNTLAQKFEESRCEDYPCCGHEAGDCPSQDSDGNEVWSCAGCGGKLPPKSRSSLCQRCIRDMSRRDREDPTGQDSDMDEASYKVASPTQARVSNDDHARTVQTEPDMTEDSDFGDDDDQFADIGGAAGAAGACPHCGNSRDNTAMGRNAQCSRCGEDYEIEQDVNPEAELHAFEPEMTDRQLGKIGKADIAAEPDLDANDLGEAVGGVVQHRSFRTIKDAPQTKDARWSDEIDESTEDKNKKKDSDVVKVIKKGQKPKKSGNSDQLKHQKPRTTKSGVHKKDK
jgi:hypothetical protein